MEKYIYEIDLGGPDFLTFIKNKEKFESDVISIVSKYKNELDTAGIKFDDSYRIDMKLGIVKIKPFQEDLPDGLAKDLHQFYGQKSGIL